MAHNSLLTASELLYEGSDYAAWRKKMEAVVVMHYLLGDDEDVFEYDTLAELYDDDEDNVHKALAATIQKNVYKGLLHRVPATVRKQPFKLLLYMDGLARPFRLLDLGEELRQRIYKIVLGIEEPQEYQIYNHVAGQLQKDRMPSLLHVSSHLRSEALPLFHQNFRFICSIRQGMSQKHDLDQIKTWGNTIAAEHVRHMRYLYLHRERSIGVQFTFTLPWGLKSDGTKYMSKAQNTLLHEHVRATNVYRKALDQEGESLIMAVTANYRLWEKLDAML